MLKAYYVMTMRDGNFFRTFSLFLAPNILKIFSSGVAQFLECEGEEKHCTVKLRKKQMTWGGGLPEDLGGGVRRVWKPLPYFRPKYVIFPTLFQT